MPYGANSWLSGKKLSEIGSPKEVVLLYETRVSEDGTRGVAFADETARRVTDAEWVRLKETSHIRSRR